MNNYIIIIYYKYLEDKKIEKSIYNFDTLKEIKDLYMSYRDKKDIEITDYKLYELKEMEISLY